MGVALIGDIAALFELQPQQNGTVSLSLAGLPDGLDGLPADETISVSGIIREAQPGYSNSPHDTPVTFHFQGRLIVDDDEAPILGVVAEIPDRTFYLKAVPAKASGLGVGTEYAAAAREPLAPGERKSYVFDLNDKLAGAALLGIEWLTPSIYAVGLGVTVLGGDDRPVVDRTNKRVRVTLACNRAATSLSALSGDGFHTGLQLGVRTAGTPYELLAGTGAVPTRNL